MHSDWELEAIAEAEQEVLRQDPVYQRLRRVSFLSNSKGKGRKRSRPVEVNLVHDVWSGRCRTWDLYPFDVYATEILPQVDPDEAEKELKKLLGGELL